MASSYQSYNNLLHNCKESLYIVITITYSNGK